MSKLLDFGTRACLKIELNYAIGESSVFKIDACARNSKTLRSDFLSKRCPLFNCRNDLNLRPPLSLKTKRNINEKANLI